MDAATNTILNPRMDVLLLLLLVVLLLIATLFWYRKEKKRQSKDFSDKLQELSGQLACGQKANERANKENATLRALLDHAQAALAEGDVRIGLIAYDSKTGQRLLGEKTEDALKGFVSEEPLGEMREYLQAKCQEQSSTIAVSRDGKSFWAQIDRSGFDGVQMYAVKDATAIVTLRNMEIYEQRYDKLTGMYNQSVFMENARSLFAEKETLGVCCALVLRTEYISGHNAGIGHKRLEEYIQACAAVLKKNSGSGMFSRYSNEEFYGILYGYPNRQAAEEDLNQIWVGMAEAAIDLALPHEPTTRINVGVSWYPEDSDSIDELISYANFCVYIARKNGTFGIETFDRKVFQRDGYLLHGRAGFAEMVAKRMVRFAFQPVVCVATAKIYGYELLMRPQHKSMRNIGDVINLAVAQGQTHAIEMLTWFEGMKAFTELVEAGKIRYDAKAFVNSIGGTCLTESESEEFTEKYYDYLKNIVTEITESQQESEEYTAIKRQQAVEWGSQIAIDDYGTGYNSELSLLFFRPSIVKVDIAFVRDIDKDVDKQVLFKNLIHYAKERGISVLAEGVETYGELKTVIEFGADYIQGYYLGMPEFVPKELSAKHMTEIGAIRYGAKRGETT